MNQKRRGLGNVFKLAEQGEYKKLLIEYPDRLTRFGYAYIERHLKYCGVEVIAIAEKELAETNRGGGANRFFVRPSPQRNFQADYHTSLIIGSVLGSNYGISAPTSS